MFTFKENKRTFGLWKAVYCWWTDLFFVEFFWKVIYFGQNIYHYASLLWHDRDWDYSYLLSLLEFKLSRMAKHVAKHDMHTNSQKIAKEIAVASALCKRIREDNYYELPLKKLDEEYGRFEFREGERYGSGVEVIIDRPFSRKGTPEYKTVTAKESRIFDAARKQKQRDLKYLFNLLEKKIEYWWC